MESRRMPRPRLPSTTYPESSGPRLTIASHIPTITSFGTCVERSSSSTPAIPHTSGSLPGCPHDLTLAAQEAHDCRAGGDIDKAKVERYEYQPDANPAARSPADGREAVAG